MASPGARYGLPEQSLEEREATIIAFSDGETAEFAAKPVLAGSGCNFQRHCAWAIFLGIGFKFNDFIQSIHRVHRFGQAERVRIDIVHTEAEREVLRTLQTKWAQHEEMSEKMTASLIAVGYASLVDCEQFTWSLG